MADESFSLSMWTHCVVLTGDEMAGGGEEKEELEEEVRVLEKRQHELELSQRELFITICQVR